MFPQLHSTETRVVFKTLICMKRNKLHLVQAYFYKAHFLLTCSILILDQLWPFRPQYFCTAYIFASVFLVTHMHQDISFGYLSPENCTVERSLMVRWVDGLTPHSELIKLFHFQPVLHSWYNKVRGMCLSVCGMVFIYILTLAANRIE